MPFMQGNSEEIQLKKAITELVQMMSKQNLLPPNVRPEEIIEEVFEKIKDSKPTYDDLREKNVQKAIIGSILAVALNDEKLGKECLDILNSDKKNEPDFKPSKDLDKKLFPFLALAAKLNEAQDKEMTPNELAKHLLKPSPDKKVEKDEEEEKTATKDDSNEKALTDTLRNLFGGDDPRKVGEVQGPVLTEIGNLLGLTHQGQTDPNSKATMTREITLNTDQSDPLGLENLLKGEDLANGFIDVVAGGVSSLPTMKPH